MVQPQLRGIRMSERKLEGLQKTIQGMAQEKAQLHKENTRLKKELGILEEKGFIEDPSLPLIKFGPTGRPYCEKHGAMLAYDHQIYRCEACKSAVQLPQSSAESQNIFKEEQHSCL